MKALCRDIVSFDTSKHINQSTVVVERSLEAAVEAEVPGRASNSRDDDFLLVLFL